MLKSSASQRLVTIITVLLGVCCSSSALWAQENPTPPTSEMPTDNIFLDDERNVRYGSEPTSGTELYRTRYTIRNVKASLMAYWLDPDNHPAPIELQTSRGIGFDNQSLQNIPRLPGNGNGPLGLKLPRGVTSITAIDPQNALLATGTKEGLLALRPLITSADVSLVQYEIEAQFLQIPRGSLSATGLKFGKPTQESPYAFGSVTMVPASFQRDKIAELVKNKHIKVLTAPRVTVIDGFSAQLQTTTTTPFVTDADLVKQYAQPAPASPEAATQLTTSTPGVAYLTTAIGFHTTAIQGKDDLVTLAIAPTLGTRSISVTATVRDGESFAIQMSPSKEANQVVVIVTPRRIRRATD